MTDRTLDDLETPAVVIDLARVQANIDRFQAHADEVGLQVRPHIKTHKLPQVARMQIAAGAVGITCQKVSEAEAMVAGDEAIRDVLITYNVFGKTKVQRLRGLASHVALSVVADSQAIVAGLSEGFAGATSPLRVLIECDTGGKRCGVASPEAARDLAKIIAVLPNLTFEGLMTYPAAGAAQAAAAFMKEAKRLIEAEGISVSRVTSGGTPDIWQSRTDDILTEYRPGTYVYNDRSLVERGVATYDDCALRVLATVVSVPNVNRAIIDAGSKVLTSDLLGLTGHGAVIGRPDLVIDQLSEEHGRIVSDGPIGLSVGEQLWIVPNHACVVTNMFDQVHVLVGDDRIETWPVAARGKVV